MSLSAREQQALDSIKDELAGSDPGLAAMLSAFSRLTSDEEIPDREKIRPGSRRAFRRLRRGRRRSRLRRAYQRLGSQRTALLFLSLLTAAAVVIGVAAAQSPDGNHGACAEMAGFNCVSPAPAHSAGSSSRQSTTGQESGQRIADIPQTGP
jgi:hypothetical protein